MEHPLKQSLQQRLSRSWILGLLSCCLCGVSAAEEQRVRAQLISPNQTVLSAEVNARLASLPFRDGQAFKAGELLAGFDCVLYNAQRDKAVALNEVAVQSLATVKRLHERDMSSDLELFQAQSKVKETAAEAEIARVTVSRCVIKAPFDGRVSRLAVAQHQFVTAGTQLMEIVDRNKLEVQAVVPSAWLAWLREGDSFSIRVDEMGRDYRARVVRLAAKIDAVSQMAPIAGEIAEEGAGLLPGMSGWAVFQGGQ